MTSITNTTASALSQLFQKADSNQSKSLSRDEFTQLGKSITQDGLGSVAGTGGNRSGPTVADVFSKLDTNNDAQLSEAEFTDGAQLAEKVKSALLAAQEITSGGTLLSLLSGGNGNNESNSFAGIFGTSTNNPAGTDTSLNAAIQQWLDLYAANNSSTDSTPTPGVKTTA